MKKRFTEEQIIGVPKEGEAGLKPAALCRKSPAPRRRPNLPQLESEIRRHDRFRRTAREGT
jgi:hypothetical protein